MSAQVARKASCMNWLKNSQSNRPGRSGRRKPTGLNIPGETVLKMTTVHSETVAEKLPTVSRREGIEHLPNTLFGGKTQVLNQLTAIDIVSTSCFFLD